MNIFKAFLHRLTGKASYEEQLREAALSEPPGRRSEPYLRYQKEKQEQVATYGLPPVLPTVESECRRKLPEERPSFTDTLIDIAVDLAVLETTLDLTTDSGSSDSSGGDSGGFDGGGGDFGGGGASGDW